MIFFFFNIPVLVKELLCAVYTANVKPISRANVKNRLVINFNKKFKKMHKPIRLHTLWTHYTVTNKRDNIYIYIYPQILPLNFETRKQ